ncbi:Hypothetical protein AJAP_42890 (plasmid) [Amycolatopsis japonica]|uniref:Helix-turn-helix domain-containing protein n=1 Tax=Amycolatopsis japonica TaxID=208439 RepID=A0A075VEL7_9PSEU|nr:hypothetical protein [Amycolatopsis japonica]AIG81345.1 Hypothetical protein AJAP_42890 [Amycolatopsis japonica]
MFDTHDPDTEMAIRHGRGFPYTTVGQWVLLADLPSQSKTLYALLRMHVNGQRRDDTCWPTQATLAGLMRLKKPTDVGKYTRPLVELGAVEIEEVRWGPNRMYKRLIYTVHEAPPGNFGGHITLTSFYGTKVQVSPNIPQKGGPATPSKGHPVTRSKGRPDLPQKGDQQPEPSTTTTEEQPESKEGAAAPLPVLGRSAPCGPGRLALEQPAHRISGQLETPAVEVTHHTRAHTRELPPLPRPRFVQNVDELPEALHPDDDRPFAQTAIQAGASTC